MRIHRLLWLLILIMALGISACDQDDPQTVQVPTLPGPPDIPLDLAVLRADNIGAAQLLGVYQQGPATAAAINAATNRAALGDSSGNITLLDLSTGDVIATRQMEAAIVALAISPSGALVAASDADGVVRVWGRDDAPRFTRTDADQAVLALAFNADGTRLAGAGEDGIVWVWETTDGERERQTIALDTSIRSLAFSPDGFTLAAGGRDGIIRLIVFLDPDAAPIDVPLPTTPIESINAIRAAANERRQQATGIDRTYTIHQSAVTTLLGATLAQGDPVLISGSFDGYVGFYNPLEDNLAVASGVQLPIEGDPSGVRGIGLGVAGDMITVGYRFGQIYTYDLSSRRLIDTADLPRGPLSADELLTIGYWQDGRTLAAITRDGLIWVFGAAEGARPTETPIPSATFTPTNTATNTATPTETATPSDTPTATIVNTARPSNTPSDTPTASRTPSATRTPRGGNATTVATTDATTAAPDAATATATRTPSLTRTPSETVAPSATATLADTGVDANATAAPSATPTATPTATDGPTSSPTATEAPTEPPAETACTLESTIGSSRIRSGPGTTYGTAGALDEPTAADGRIVGADDFVWYRLVDDLGWVREDVVTASVGCDQLPIVSFTP